MQMKKKTDEEDEPWFNPPEPSQSSRFNSFLSLKLDSL